MHISGDTACGHSFTECELAGLLICTLLVAQNMTCIVSGGELAVHLIGTSLIT